MKRTKVLALLLAAASAGLACDEKGAYGFEFGKPVPESASREQRDGGSVPNAMGCFDGAVPAPIPEFEKYGYCANRDRKFVYAITEFREFMDEKNADDEIARKAAFDKVRKEILVLKATLEERYGLKYQPDYANGLSWTAEGPVVTSWITVLGRQLRVECTHRKFEADAFRAGMQSWR